uniref:HipA-like kinase domain-containing protein n=2 Tax=Cohnella candidum TaxID=2674991 RepID=A0A3G3JWK5_9BACL|nr:hypothetical protein EAV92_06390 [Cohnella candidum]
MKSWTVLREWKAKRQGQVWIVRHVSGKRGYFKYATRKQWYFAGPFVANEYIAAKLAAILGFPVAELTIARIRGKDGRIRSGVVSIAEDADEVVTWREAGGHVRSDPARYVNRIDLLRQLIVFDAWITNLDRSNGRNLILYRNRESEKYDWYLIDHGNTLYGSPRKWKRGTWRSPIWQRVWRFCHTPRGLLRLQSSWEVLEPMVSKIESLTEKQIDAALNSVPIGYIGGEHKQFTKRLLLSRKKQLRGIMKRWLAFRGIKESKW